MSRSRRMGTAHDHRPVMVGRAHPTIPLAATKLTAKGTVALGLFAVMVTLAPTARVKRRRPTNGTSSRSSRNGARSATTRKSLPTWTFRRPGSRHVRGGPGRHEGREGDRAGPVVLKASCSSGSTKSTKHPDAAAREAPAAVATRPGPPLDRRGCSAGGCGRRRGGKLRETTAADRPVARRGPCGRAEDPAADRRVRRRGTGASRPQVGPLPAISCWRSEATGGSSPWEPTARS